MYRPVLDKDLSNVAVMHMLTRVNHERIDENPPGLDFEVEDPEHMKVLIDNAKKGAYQYDAYQDIVQVSFLYKGTFLHFLQCEDAPQIINTGNTIITVSESEFDMLRDVTTFVNNIHIEVDGTVNQPTVFAGWQLKERMWPLLLNKAFAHDLFVPYSLMSDPMRKFQTTEYLMEIATMYSQGAWGGTRRLPALPDVLTYWGYGTRDKYPTISTADLCTDPTLAAGEAEIYLRDLNQAVRDYYTRS